MAGFRSHLDLLHPSLSQRVQQRQRCQKEQHDQHAREHSIEIGDRVYSRNFSGKPDWLSGVVTERSGPVSYCVKLDDNNCVIRHHQDHIRGKTDCDDVSTATDIEHCAVRDPVHTFDQPPAPLPELPQIEVSQSRDILTSHVLVTPYWRSSQSLPGTLSYGAEIVNVFI